MAVKSAVLLTYLFGVLVLTILASPYDACAARRREPRSVQYSRTVSNMIYNDNWAGALMIKERGSISFVRAQFIVPAVSNLQDDLRGVAVVLNIDGYTCWSQGFLQAGFDITVVSGVTSYTSWVYLAGGSVLPAGVSASAGDHTALAISILNPTSAKVLIQNLSTDEVNTIIVWTDLAEYALCQMDAGWIIGALPQTADASDFYPIPNFGTVDFELVGAATGENFYPLSDAQTKDIPSLTFSSVQPQNYSVTVQYTGP